MELNNFYSKLRAAHFSIDIQEISTNIQLQHDFLNPTLRPYQENAVKWMMKRELTPDYFTPEYFKITSFDGDKYVDPTNLFSPFIISSNKPKNVKIPSGGILADEMGLGKTVEMLALILANKKKKRKIDEIDEDDLPLSRFLPCKGFICICNNPEDELLIVCSKCRKSQHKKCVTKYRFDETKDYMCPNCWSVGDIIVESSATIIVSPVAIKSQWESEISKHINDDRFKVFIYNGVSQTGWISPNELAEYDVVLTDYNILHREIHYLNTNAYKGALRHERKYMQPVSPLTFVHWWRVCLDEAQMVESTINNASKMVKTLPAVHRWAITGTPMEKSFDDLYGLVFFLDCKPFTVNSLWKSLTSPIRISGDCNPLVNVLKKIMWRTCKSGVLDQINIPPQTEQITYVTMSDVETFFYQSENARCSEAFRWQMILEKEKSLLLSKMSQKTLKRIMEAFRMLRQDCTVPTTFRKNHGKNETVKKILNPNQLLEHLVSKNESECRSHLRSLILSLNGIAALHIIKKEYGLGILAYNLVLKWAENYSEVNLSVDTLLQIHAIHNMFDAFTIQGVDIDTVKYKQHLLELESKYMASHTDAFKKSKDELIAIVDKITKVSANVKKDWFRTIIYENEDSGEYFEKIEKHVERSYGKQVLEEELSAPTFDFLITTWIDKIEAGRSDMKIKFEKFKYFTDNIKSKHELNQSEANKIELLVKSAVQCHLNSDTTLYKPKKVACELCQIKASMQVYEAIISSKKIYSKPELENVGTWKVTYFESMLNYIHSNYKSKTIGHELDTVIKESEMHLAYFSLLVDEYKAYSNFYNAVNCVVAAFDELNMCKLRLQDAGKPPKSLGPAIQISGYEVERKLQIFKNQLNEAETSFKRMLGRIKYLKHLDNVSNEICCPICQNEIEGRYSVLLCGHILCITCLITLAKMDNSKSICCCICRQNTNHKDIFYVTNKIEEDEFQVKGKYSSKVRAIVKNVLDLKQDDKDVKILIFSHWDNILENIGMALQENDIETTINIGSYIKAISDFKNMDLGINCILLPLHFGSKGLNLIEATHVFLVEPIMTPSEELQAIGRIHRIGQTKPTVVHRFIVKNTIEENIYNTISNDKTGMWKLKQITIEDLNKLFQIVEQGVLYEIDT